MRILSASRAGLVKTSLYTSIPRRFPLISVPSVPFQWTTQKPQSRQTCLPINYRYRSFTNIANISLRYRGVRYFSSSGQREIVSIDTNEEGTPLPDLESKLGVRTENTAERKNEEEEEQPLMKSTVKKKRSSKKNKKGVSYATRKETMGNFQGLGFSEWPASPEALKASRTFLFDAAASPHSVLLVPDRDADGLSAGTAISLTLQLLGKHRSKIHVHFVRKGRSVFDRFEKFDLEKICQKHKVGHIILLDQGSREGTESLISPIPPNSGAPERKLLIIDHHYTTSFPPNATILTSKSHRPIAPTSYLTHVLCSPLHPAAPAVTALPALIGTLGDLSASQQTLEMLRSPPFSLYMDTSAALKTYTIKWTNNLISMLNVARRSPLAEGESAIRAAWEILQFDPHADQTEWPTPKRIMNSDTESQQSLQTIAELKNLQERSKQAMDRCKRVPPKFSSDGRIAVIEVKSPWQIHPLLAGRWSQSLARNDYKPRLLAVACANTGYVPDRVNFSVRRTATGATQDVDLIALLKEYANKLMPVLKGGLGDDFARGHKDASGGSLDKDAWEVFKKQALEIQEPRRREIVEIGDYSMDK